MAARPRRKDATGQQKLDDLGIEAICDRIRDGEAIGSILRSLGNVGWAVWQAWVAADPARPARIDDARRESADTEDELALKVLDEIPPDATPAVIARAREIAQHRRWRSAKRNPSVYGDRVAVDHGIQPDAAEALGTLRALLGVAQGQAQD